MKEMLFHRASHWALEDPLFPKHMSFIIGPRQSGKTTMALRYLQSKKLSKDRYYFNWDRTDVRRRFREGIDWMSDLRKPGSTLPLVFDEIHKVRGWKRLIKGIYDQFRDDFQFIVTGSGRLDHYQRGGDSLAGRYDSYFLYPFTPGEIEEVAPQQDLNLKSIFAAPELKESLIKDWEVLGGFPEPFLSGKAAKMNRWWTQYKTRVTQEDLRDLTRLESTDLARTVLELLPTKVGAPLSIQSIREDIETSFATAKRYIQTLSQLFLIFEISPYAKKIHRAIKKEKKVYFFHHPTVQDLGAKFENMLALLLYRWVSEQNERALGIYDLCYVRDQDRREVDFVILKDSEPFFLFEAKYSSTDLSNSLRYYSERLKIPGLQIVRNPRVKITKTKSLGILSIHGLAGALG